MNLTNLIIFSAVRSDEVKKLVTEMVADSFLLKPFNSEELINKIEELVSS